jgi:hypothetical protein
MQRLLAGMLAIVGASTPVVVIREIADGFLQPPPASKHPSELPERSPP